MNDELSPVYYNKEKKFISSKTKNTQNTKNNTNNTNTQNNNIKPSPFDPDCVQKARETPDKQALKVVLAWLKKKRIPESQRNEFIKTFLAVHNLNLDSSELLDLLDTPAFSCEFVQELGFCEEENCKMKLPPSDRLILDTESVIIFHSSGEMDIKVGGRRKIVPLKKFFKKTKGETTINTALFDEIFLECYYLPPNPPFTEEEALKVYQAWLEMADHVKVPVDVESGIESAVIEILTSRKDYFHINQLKEKKVSPRHGFFLDDDGVIYVESGLFRELLDEAGVKDRIEKVSKSVQRLLIGPSKRIRIGKDLRYFWRFNLQAIQAVLRREGEEWTPELKETPEALADLMKQLEESDEEVGEGTKEVHEQ